MFDTRNLPPGTTTRQIVLEENALTRLPDVWARFFAGRAVKIAADENTWRAAGQKVREILAAAGIPLLPEYIYPSHPRLRPCRENADALAAELPEQSVAFAVGSGVINDLVKYASSLGKSPYCCIATAASVDGYTASGAALLDRGLKHTLPCPAPLAVVADLAVLRAAPPELRASGYADWAAKITGGADWLVADALEIEAIDPAIWQLVQPGLRRRLAEERTLENIFSGLAATGIAMQLYGDSRPASGMEHLCSHIWEMEHLSYRGEEVSHGFKVAVGTVAGTRLMEYVIHADVADVRSIMPPVFPREVRQRTARTLLAAGNYGEGAETIALAKLLPDMALRERRERILARWDAIRQRLAAQLLPETELTALLRLEDCPAAPEEIGLSRKQLIHGIRAAQLIRKRYTTLDMLEELGLLEMLTDQLF